MTGDLWWSVPFAGGLAVTLMLAFAGAGLFLRGSVWQALAVGQWAALGGVIAATVALPVVPVAVALAGAVMIVLHRICDRERWPLALFLAGLALVTLFAANLPQANLAAARWAEGQVYFLDRELLRIIGGVAAASLLLAPLLARIWLFAQATPDVGLRSTHRGVFVVLEAMWWVGVLVLGSAALGLPAALAALLLPAWGAASVVRGLHGFLAGSLLLGAMVFLLAWVSALHFDQPFGPVFVLWALVIAAVPRASVSLVRLRRRT
ncbi:ABC-3 protein [Thioalkalivibrio nitratireducens DSM 14787]|uniref:ABC-3 protein n=1 Tax=Thioalkalivibrio nitratireducens (strain DSM 14787 / UNIQEM 213 / ALEN2) TaxID=1255043 RepID=L0E2B8_THIND|nr:hypothetical protein [Thioalkalivibrio nitratireducens]AGA34801.1 ABC-3 protein [Thioalkalivibrio nitratireducens DSM 14787]